MINVLHLSNYDIRGGAAIAAYRIHKAIQRYSPNVSSHMLVAKKFSTDSSIQEFTLPPYQRQYLKLRNRINSALSQSCKSENPSLRSIAALPSGLRRHLVELYEDGKLDILNLHWLGNSLLSIEEIGTLPFPVVWTAHDMWPFTGSEHYTYNPSSSSDSSHDKRYVSGYSRLNRPQYESGLDINRYTWHRKLRSWKSPITLIAPSQWMASSAQASALFLNSNVYTIPYPIDRSIWFPINQEYARQSLNLPLTGKYILFGADQADLDPRKGSDLLWNAISQLRHSPAMKNTSLISFGGSFIGHTTNYGLDHYSFGPVSVQETLNLLYSAADVLILPSRQDNLPNIGLEASACGLPIIGFNTSGIPDIVSDGFNGFLATAFSISSLAEKVTHLMSDYNLRAQFSNSALEKARLAWSPHKVGMSYQHAYHEILDDLIP